MKKVKVGSKVKRKWKSMVAALLEVVNDSLHVIVDDDDDEVYFVIGIV